MKAMKGAVILKDAEVRSEVKGERAQRFTIPAALP
jgi:hypothetical protein